MISTRPLTFKSSSPFSNPLVTVPNASIKIGIIVTCMFQFFSIPKQGRATYPSFHILSVLFCGQPGLQSRQFCKFSFFFLVLIIIRSGLLAEIWWSMCMSKSHRSLCVLFSWTGAGLCILLLILLILLLRFLFAPELADGLSLESEWQQVSSGSQNFSQYSFDQKNTVCMVSILFFFFGFAVHPVYFPSLLGTFQVHQLQLVSPSPSCSTGFVVLEQGDSIFKIFSLPFIFIPWSAGMVKSSYSNSLFFLFSISTVWSSGCN